VKPAVPIHKPVGLIAGYTAVAAAAAKRAAACSRVDRQTAAHPSGSHCPWRLFQTLRRAGRFLGRPSGERMVMAGRFPTDLVLVMLHC
jgi:hypothetical protein